MTHVLVDPTSAAVRELLGDAYPQVVRFAELLEDQGVLRGLIGPREAPRLWDRHLLNSAAVAPYLPESGVLVDVGTGAGLPGIVLACLRPDLHTVLLEPMERRVRWLTEVVAELGLHATEVVRGRAGEVHLPTPATTVTARAVAPLDRLAEWTLPMLAVGGSLLAMKGDRAADEIAAAEVVVRRLGGGPAELVEAAVLAGVTPTTVVRITKERDVPPPVQAAPRRPAAKRPSTRRRA